MSGIPEEYHDLFEKGAFAHFASVLPDGSPHVVPVWIDYDGEHVLVNTLEERQKTKNVQQNPAVAVSMVDPDNPYRKLTFRGEVVEVTKEGAVEHIHEVCRHYTGRDYPTLEQEDSPRIILRVRVDRVMS